MKCIECGIETGFEWPVREALNLRTVWENHYEEPLCKLCSGNSLLRSLLDTQEPSEQFCLALLRRGDSNTEMCDFGDLIESDGPANLEPPSLDDVEDL
jgi:hypothetical protein